MDNGCEKCAQVEGLCPDCEIEMLEADIGRSMNRIEKLKQKKQKLEQERKLQCPAQMISEPQSM